MISSEHINAANFDPAVFQVQVAMFSDLTSFPATHRVRYSTVGEYHAAMTDPTVENLASENIDAGREPYLISMEAAKIGTHPYITIHDVMTDMQNGRIGLATSRHTFYFDPQTLLAWR